ncbi:hypothetical protein [Sphingobium sp.]|uniref:hypothetical protein n=1 Tax=Sphingobium sp. TaxID=1912891 RepID=UPI003B3BDF8A
MEFFDSSVIDAERTDFIPSDDHAPAMSAARRPAELSPLELSVIGLSLTDPVASITGAPRWHFSMPHLMRTEKLNRLANDRLEELRRFSIIFRVRNKVDPLTLRRLVDAGYTLEQADLVQQTILRKTAAQRARRPKMLAWLVLALIALMLFGLMQMMLGETIISLIITGVGFATLASVAAPRDHVLR